MICAITWAPVIRSMSMRARALERLDTRMGSSFEACLEDVSTNPGTCQNHQGPYRAIGNQLEYTESFEKTRS